jgi:hypothetical protein
MENSWLFPLVEAFHLIGLAMLVGTIVLEDLSVLGWLALPAPLVRWMKSGLALSVATGLALLLADLDRYPRNPAFAAKMVILAAALAVHATLRRRGSRTGAILSLALWTLVVLSARAVIDFDV